MVELPLIHSHCSHQAAMFDAENIPVDIAQILGDWPNPTVSQSCQPPSSNSSQPSHPAVPSNSSEHSHPTAEPCNSSSLSQSTDGHSNSSELSHPTDGLSNSSALSQSTGGSFNSSEGAKKCR